MVSEDPHHKIIIIVAEWWVTNILYGYTTLFIYYKGTHST